MLEKFKIFELQKNAILEAQVFLAFFQQHESCCTLHFNVSHALQILFTQIN